MRIPICIAVALLLQGCTTANLGSGAEANQTQAVTLDMQPDEAYVHAAQTAATFGWAIENSDAAAGVITASYEGALTRFGDTVSIVVRPLDGGGSTVTVRSTLGQGPNSRHVAEYLARLAE